jgi:outer membrane protein TolC
MIRKVSVLFFAVFCISVSSSFSETMNLEQCINAGINYNPEVIAADMMVNSLKSGIKEARAGFLPSISASGNAKRLSNISSSGASDTDYLDQNAASYSIQLSQTIYSGSKIVNTYKKAKLEKEKYEADKKFKKIEIAYKIKVKFFETMKAQEESRILAKKIESMEAGLERAKALYEKRFVPKSDFLEAKVDLENARLEKSISENNIKRKKAELLSLMGMQPDSLIKFVKTSPEKMDLNFNGDFYSLYEMAKVQRPDLKSMIKQVEITNKNSALSKGRYLPEVKFTAGYYDSDKNYDDKGTGLTGEYNRDQRNRYWSAGVSVQVPIFDGGKAFYSKKRYDNQVKNYEYLLKNRENSIKTGIKKALYSIEDSKYRIKSSKEAKKSAEEFAEMEKKRFEKGISTIADLIIAEEKLARAKSNFESAKLDLKLAFAELGFMVGQI